MKTVLNVGCGPRLPDKLSPVFRTAEWREVRLDVDPAVEPDIVASLTDLSGVATASCDAIWSSHNLEHLYAHEVGIALREFHRVLKPEGFLLLTLPDLQAVAKVIADGGVDQVVMRTRIGGQEGPPITALDVVFGHGWWIERGRTFMAHRTGFSAESLAQRLIDAGFLSVAVRRGAALDLWAWAGKIRQAADMPLLNNALGAPWPAT